jgi:hypothetical protein
LFALALVACGDDNGTDPSMVTTGEIRLVHVVDGVPLAFDDLSYENATGDTYSVKRLEYILTDVSLVTSAARLAVTNAHYCDAFEATTTSMPIDDLPPGTYDAVTFTFGLDCEINLGPNQGGELPTTTQWQGMLWPMTWGGGYHYMKLEGDYDDGSGLNTYRTHVGRRFAQSDPTFGDDDAPIPHYFTVTLPFDAVTVSEGDTWSFEVIMNVNEWYTGPNDLAMTSDGIMMNTDVQNLLEENGATVFSVGDVAQR